MRTMTKAEKLFDRELTAAPLPALSDDEINAYSLHRAIRIAAGAEDGPRLEKEVSDALGSRMSHVPGRNASPLVVPDAALGTSTAGAGSELVIDRRHPAGFADVLRSRSVTAALGATVYSDLGFPARLPRITGDVEIFWRVENPGSDVDDTQPDLNAIFFELHSLVANVPFTRQLIAQSAGNSSVERIVRHTIASAIVEEIDRAAINGLGSAGEPLGILATPGVNIVPIAANGGPVAYAQVVDLEAAVAADDAEAVRLGWAATPAVRKALRGVESFAGAGAVWPGEAMLGHRAATSTNLPSDGTKGTGTNLHTLLYADWSDLLIGSLGALDVIVDPYARKREGIVEVLVTWHGDIQLAHPESFAATPDIEVS